MNMVHLIFAMTLSSSWSAIPLGDPFWTPATKEELKLVNPKERVVKAKQKAYFKCDFTALKAKLEKSPLRNSPEAKRNNYLVTFPWPDGELVAFSVNRVPNSYGFLFDGVSVKDSRVTIAGHVISDLLRATISGEPLKHDVRLGIAAPPELNLYGSYFFVLEEQKGR